MVIVPHGWARSNSRNEGAGTGVAPCDAPGSTLPACASQRKTLIMKIGYPCSNLSVGCSTARTFRLASLNEERLFGTVSENLDCLERTLAWNAEHGIAFFRISSTTVPFASHPAMTFDWQSAFRERLGRLGRWIRDHGMRINVHPGQYTLLNSPKPEVVEQSVRELVYHAELMDLMGLDHTHKIQIHTGGVYGDKDAAIDRFVRAWETLPPAVQVRLVIENDERQYSLVDNLRIHERTGIPLLLDTFHHSILNDGLSLPDAIAAFVPTWDGHGAPMLDYSSQHAEKQVGAHTVSIDIDDFTRTLDQLGGRDVDIMLEIKDKEASALKALEVIRGGIAVTTAA
jgi:UV DNA damage endonuclease